MSVEAESETAAAVAVPPPVHKFLSRYESMVLDQLAAAPNQFVSKAALEAALYGVESECVPPTNCLEVFIYRLRSKGISIENKRKRGYRLVKQTSESSPQT